jgi:hypothetical protein
MAHAVGQSARGPALAAARPLRGAAAAAAAAAALRPAASPAYRLGLLSRSAGELLDASPLPPPRARRVAACAAAEPPAATAAPLPGINLAALAPGDLVRCELAGAAPGDAAFYLEVLKRRRDGVVEAVCEGELLALAPGAPPAHRGHWPRLGDAWVRAAPGLAEALAAARRRQDAAGGAARPSAALAARGVAAASLATSEAVFEAEVAADPAFWRDGAAPGAPPPAGDAAALLSAGELLTFLHGARGIALVQLRLDAAAGDAPPGAPSRLPLLRPFTLRALRRCAESKGVALIGSRLAAAGAPATSIVVAAKAAPYRAWGAHLAAVGVQASLVAGSPFYQALVGRILGYPAAHVAAHVAEQGGGPLEARVAAAVEAELAALSCAEPRLPWPGAQAPGGAAPLRR